MIGSVAALECDEDARPSVREVFEDGPNLVGRLVYSSARLTIRPALALGSRLPRAPWPFGLVDFAARMVPQLPGTVGAAVELPHCTARLVCAAGVAPVGGAARVVLYLPGGAFLAGGPHTHGRTATRLSQYGRAPVLVIDYRKIPRNSVGDAVDDCHDGYRWLRRQGFAPHQIVLAGDSAGGYLSLALAERLIGEDERPAAIAMMSPLLQIAAAPKQTHPNMATDAMFPAKAFDALAELVAGAARLRGERVYEPLQHITPGLPPVLIHVSGSEVLLHDARLAARMLAEAGVPVEMRVWPGQLHAFQIAAPMVPESGRSLRQIGTYIRAVTGIPAADVARHIGVAAK